MVSALRIHPFGRLLATYTLDGLADWLVSIGLAVTQGKAGDAADIEALIAEADAGLYRAKQGGRNRVEG